MKYNLDYLSYPFLENRCEGRGSYYSDFITFLVILTFVSERFIPEIVHGGTI
jgi:hypothetical protein